MLEVQTTTYPLADYLSQLDRGEISVNRDYQRAKGIWPLAARSFLVETVLKNFPIPKLSLHHRTDPATLVPHREVVDGQQRTYALHDFLGDRFRLSNRIDTEEWHGKRFSDLADTDKRQFLNYGLNFDLLIGAEDDEVREVFRRMNTFTVSLNYEEQRNAAFDGKFKWFIRELAQDYTNPFLTAGVFKNSGLIRMADAKLLTEITHAYFYGIKTTNSRSLDKVYSQHDNDFDEQDELEEKVREALDYALSFEIFHEGPLFKPFEFYSFVLAVMHVTQRIPALKAQVKLAPSIKTKSDSIVVENLGALDAALIADEDGDDIPKKFASFIEASDTKTNTREQRVTRVRWFCKALTTEF
jgi:Protein of unknown function DUF262